MRRRSCALIAGALLSVVALSGCVQQVAPSGGASASGAASTSAPSSTPTAAPTVDPIAGMTLAQQVGQIFMVGTTAGAAQPAAWEVVLPEETATEDLGLFLSEFLLPGDVVALVGELGTGKTTLARYIAEARPNNRIGDIKSMVADVISDQRRR